MVLMLILSISSISLLKIRKLNQINQLNITKCDESIKFKAAYITDLSDYRHRENAFYVIDVYRISMFAKEDPSSLIHSVLLSTIKRVPQELKGAENCIEVDGGSVTAEITICLGSKTTTSTIDTIENQILDQIKKFESCRTGDSLIPQSPKIDAEVCVKKEEKKGFEIRKGNKWDEDRDKFIQIDYSVPGTI